eukprot:m.83806 g.83806  ORF g.83806 m.83806 type:complete len:160 (+) comp9561_c0_seq2:290-769(+)
MHDMRFADLVQRELLDVPRAEQHATVSPHGVSTKAAVSTPGPALSGCAMLGPGPVPHVVHAVEDGLALGRVDVELVHGVGRAAYALHPAGEPTSFVLDHVRYTVARCERGHVLAVAAHEERGVIISALPHGVLVSMYRAPTTLPRAASIVYRFAGLLRA